MDTKRFPRSGCIICRRGTVWWKSVIGAPGRGNRIVLVGETTKRHAKKRASNACFLTDGGQQSAGSRERQ